MEEKNNWNKCTEETYPEDVDTDFILIAYKDYEEHWNCWTYRDCPFGWKVLCNSNAYWMTIELPENKK